MTGLVALPLRDQSRGATGTSVDLAGPGVAGLGGGAPVTVPGTILGLAGVPVAAALAFGGSAGFGALGSAPGMASGSDSLVVVLDGAGTLGFSGVSEGRLAVAVGGSLGCLAGPTSAGAFNFTRGT